jgi:antitoxin component YwqK of YwqJK toxin-antitoxin module
MITWTSVKTNQIKNGKWKEFNKHAVLIAEGFYVNNKKHGVWREYYDQTGTLMIEEEYKHGIQHGRYASFHPNGQLFSEGNFLDGLRQGHFKVYDEDGNNIRNLFFVDNRQVEYLHEFAFKEGSTEQRKTGS